MDLHFSRDTTRRERGGAPPDVRIFLELGEVAEWIPYLPKPGIYKHGKYGAIDVTPERIARMVANMNNGIYQTRIPLDAEHTSKMSGAMGWISALRQNVDGSADAYVEWTDRGRVMLKNKRFQYVSPEWFTRWEDPATGEQHDDVVIGGALTTRPFFKEGVLRSLAAAEDTGAAPPMPGKCIFCGAKIEKSPTGKMKNMLVCEKCLVKGKKEGGKMWVRDVERREAEREANADTAERRARTEGGPAPPREPSIDERPEPKSRFERICAGEPVDRDPFEVEREKREKDNLRRFNDYIKKAGPLDKDGNMVVAGPDHNVEREAPQKFIEGTGIQSHVSAGDTTSAAALTEQRVAELVKQGKSVSDSYSQVFAEHPEWYAENLANETVHIGPA